MPLEMGVRKELGHQLGQPSGTRGGVPEGWFNGRRGVESKRDRDRELPIFRTLLALPVTEANAFKCLSLPGFFPREHRKLVQVSQELLILLGYSLRMMFSDAY